MNSAYVQGFVQKCAEAGVDPQQLVKKALSPAFVLRTAPRLLNRLSQRMGLLGRTPGGLDSPAFDRLISRSKMVGRRMLPETYNPTAVRAYPGINRPVEGRLIDMAETASSGDTTALRKLLAQHFPNRQPFQMTPG